MKDKTFRLMKSKVIEAPFVGALVGGLTIGGSGTVLQFSAELITRGFSIEALSEAGYVFLLVSFLATSTIIAVMLPLGMTIMLVLHKWNVNSSSVFTMTCGALALCLAFAFFDAPWNDTTHWELARWWTSALFCSIIVAGALSGLTIWRIAYSRIEPDETAP